MSRGELKVGLDANYLLANPVPLSFFNPEGCLHAELSAFNLSQGPTHLGTATLFGETSGQLLKDTLNDWAVRVNGCYLGRRWYVSTFQTQTLCAFINVFQDVNNAEFYAVFVIRPPAAADPQDFITRAPTFFAQEHLLAFPPLGDMTLELIGSGGGTRAL
jgi:hypothetical protein